MKALQKTDTGLSLTEIRPPIPGTNEVVVKVMCAGLCRTDLYVAQGKLSSEPPITLGHECAGVICRLGDGVPQESLGQRVAVFPWRGCGHCTECAQEAGIGAYRCARAQFMGWHIHGAFANFVVVGKEQCFGLPPSVSFQAGAYFEPVLAALGVLSAPYKKAGAFALLGDNRIARLSSAILADYAKCRPEILQVGEGVENSHDLVVETSATEESIADALRILRPGGLLVLKSRPPDLVRWPIRTQVEKEITTMGIGYGTVRLAMLLLEKKVELFSSLWNEPVSLESFESIFSEAQDNELKKAFFLPQEA